MNVPDGGVVCPLPLCPQQATVPSLLTPQVWRPPASTEEAEPPEPDPSPAPAPAEAADVESVPLPGRLGPPGAPMRVRVACPVVAPSGRPVETEAQTEPVPARPTMVSTAI